MYGKKKFLHIILICLEETDILIGNYNTEKF